jgi:adenylate kinase family enzyme
LKLIDARKISIVGNSGAGKSTVSSKLAKSLKLSVFPIDLIYWLPNWQVRDKKSYKQLHDEWLSQESWLIDGIGYWSELEERLPKSDLVIF